ncbi:zinc transporter ZntB [Marivibrio halodurans]|uniref:Zinc transporter ZntB n=1 Tax=Marivibrio halodurans TaxID=2039722 RepID=A0A8J7V3L2_9PROT|nr:zinc transporter ZntB [Marivibrio halodurans]MBP5856894.1 zinc transporter ZntB [Marivibrio halodurans]
MREQVVEEGWLLFALALDGAGGAEVLDEAALRRLWREPDDRPLWVHLRRDMPEAQAWLRDESGFDELLCDRLLAEETRPGAEPVEDWLSANLRGVNLNPGAEPEDMVSLRLCCGPRRLVTLRLKTLRAVQDVRTRLEAGRGPRTTIEILHAVADRLAERMHGVVMNLEEEVDGLEVDLEEDSPTHLAVRRHQLSDVRRRAAQLRRFIAPQREALALAAESDLDWLKEGMRRRLRDVRERTGRVLDDLDGVRERASVGFDEAVALQGERMNRTMYTLAIVAGVFLPLGFITGLLGINVGGMPGVENGDAFWIVCALLAGLGLGVWAYFKRRGWM